MNPKTWFKRRPPSSYRQRDAIKVVTSLCQKGSGTVHQQGATSHCSEENRAERFKVLVEALEGHNPRQIYKQNKLVKLELERRWCPNALVAQIDQTWVSLYHRNLMGTRACIEVDVVGLNQAQVAEIMATLEPHVYSPEPPKTKRAVWALVQEKSGLDLQVLGEIKTKFEPDNYSEATVSAYEHMCECLNSKDPCGRLSILDGSPGTGKSYLIRSLIASIDAYFIIIPSNMLGSLSGPSLLPVLSQIQRSGSQPLVLILEDADRALVARQQGNLGALAEVLNFSDGLVGELLDVRLVATTNARIAEFDPAISRDGRLCSHLNLEALSQDQANRIYHRLTEQTLPQRGALSLAEIYRLARRTCCPVRTRKVKPAGGTYL